MLSIKGRSVVVFEPDEKISQIEAIDLLTDLALYGNYIPLDAKPFGLISEVAEYLGRRGKSIPECAEEMRLYSEKPKYFFNLVGPTWHGSGVKVSHVDLVSGNEKQILSGDGQYHSANYWAKFDQAEADFERAMKEANHELLLSAFAKGQAAIENYLNVLPIDGIKDCSVEDKLKKVYLAKYPEHDWNEERGHEPWSSFIELKKVRNKQEIHNKENSSGFTYEEIHRHFNLFPKAISKTLFTLHKLTERKCPASIIRSSYHPYIRMKKLEGNHA
ncbi:MAG: hypothetical protein EPO19_07080 [Betaproteobacteria bacterium]|nr:MAG: hypothetical protein EPO19_07080 [Betaproteobacteria bacterium]